MFFKIGSITFLSIVSVFISFILFISDEIVVNVLEDLLFLAFKVLVLVIFCFGSLFFRTWARKLKE
jgi:hypothetical protein